MAYTANKKYSVQAAGANAGVWGAGGAAGDDLNTGVMGLIDTQLAGLVTNSVSSSNVSLSYANIQCCMFRFTGTLLANIVVSPAVGDAATYFNGFYYWENLTTGSFTITLTTGAGSVVLPQSRRGALFVDATNGPRIVSAVGSTNADPIPVGSKTIWYNAAAPTGWTAVALNDYAISVVTAGGGGAISGTIPYSTLFARTDTDNYTLLIADIPPHTHTALGSSQNNYGIGATAALRGDATTTGTTGGGGAHKHGLDMRVQTATFTLCSRD